MGLVQQYIVLGDQTKGLKHMQILPLSHTPAQSFECMCCSAEQAGEKVISALW